MTVPSILGKPVGGEGLDFLKAGGIAARDGLDKRNHVLSKRFFRAVEELTEVVSLITDGTQTLTTAQIEGLVGMLPEVHRMAFLGWTMERAGELGKNITAEEINEFANAAEPAPAKPFRGVFPILSTTPKADEGPALGAAGLPAPQHIESGAIEYRISTLALADAQAEANRLGADGWELVAQSSVGVAGELSPPALIMTFMRASKSGTSRRDGSDLRTEPADDNSVDQRAADDLTADSQARGRGGRDDRVSLPVVR